MRVNDRFFFFFYIFRCPVPLTTKEEGEQTEQALKIKTKTEQNKYIKRQRSEASLNNGYIPAGMVEYPKYCTLTADTVTPEEGHNGAQG